MPPDRVWVGGTFDLFHYGHVALLRRAASLGEVWVSLNTDEFCERYKRKPVLTLEERWDAVEACRYVSQVVINIGEEDSSISIEFVRPRFLVHGDDWTGRGFLKQLGVTEEWLDAKGIELVYFPYTDSISSSQIIQRCCDLSPEPHWVALDVGKPALPDSAA